MRLLSLDPSSTVIGLAVLNERAALLAAELITPHKQGLPAEETIRSLLSELSAAIREHRPTGCVVELPGEATYRRHVAASKGDVRKLAGIAKRLGRYAMVAGAVYGYLVDQSIQCGFGLVGVPATTWTRGAKKAKRLELIRLQFPAYADAHDPGGDVGDAIGLGLWWLHQDRLAMAARASRLARKRA